MRHNLTLTNNTWSCVRCGAIFDPHMTAEEIVDLSCPGVGFFQSWHTTLTHLSDEAYNPPSYSGLTPYDDATTRGTRLLRSAGYEGEDT